jgi:hypothetical protein
MIDLADTTFRAYRRQDGRITLHLKTFLLIHAEIGFRLSAYLRDLRFTLTLPGLKDEVICTYEYWDCLAFRCAETLMAHNLWVSAVVGKKEVKQCVATLRMDYHLSFTGHPAEEPATWQKKVIVVPMYRRAS